MRTGETSLLSVRDLHVEFRAGNRTVHAVSGVTLDVAPGSSVGIVGESGSGKSATIMAACRLLPVEGTVVSGTVTLAGVDVLALRGRRLREFRGRSVGVVFQNPLTSLDPLFRVGSQVTEGLWYTSGSARVTDRKQRIAAAERLLRNVHISAPSRVARSYPHEISGGMRQRASIASALALEPRLIVADEPTTALDVTVQAQVLNLFREIRATRQTSLIFVSHDLSVVSQTCDAVYVMYGGKVVERGSSRELFASPRHPYTRRLLAAIPGFEASERPLSGIPGSPPDLTQRISGCPFAPRCERRIKRCDEIFPEGDGTDDHVVWCHNPV